MSRSSHLFVSVFLCLLFIASLLPRSTSSQSTSRSVSLNGTTSSVDVPYNSTLNITGPLTVEAWVKVNAIDGNYHDIISRMDRNTAGSGGGYAITVTNLGKLRLDLFQTNSTYITLIGATPMSAGAWHHIAGVFDGSQMRVYLDGVLDGSLNTTSAPASGTGVLRIGRAGHTPGAPPLYLPSFAFAGLIDEVRVSAAALYTSNFTPGLGPGSNVRGLWKFDGQTANDSSGNSNNGSLQNGATYSTDVPPATNIAPTVSLTHPLNNTSIAAGSNIVMDATASDSDGSVTKVEFYQGTTLLGSDTTAPYTFVWTNVAAGTYTLTAKATDNGSATTTSSAIAVNVFAAGGSHSISLNGTTSSVDVAYNSTLNITGPLTVEAWIKVNSIDGSYHDIISRMDRNTAGSGGGYSISVNNVGKLRMDLFQTNSAYITLIGTTVVSAGAWHHIAGVFDGSQMRVYLDGVLDGSLNTTSAPASGTGVLRIGRAGHTPGAPPLYLPSFAFAGLIDEVRVSAAALYASNFTPGLGPGSNVRGLWKFDGQTANDSSGNSNNGSLQNGATYSTDVPPATGGPQRPVPAVGGPYSGQLGQAVQFSSSGSFDPDGTIASYYWNFGDGTSASIANPTHTYAGPGLYTATLTVTDNTGLRASATAVVTISGTGNARLDPLNKTGGSGENPLSRNFNWTLPLVGLPGRAGMDLNLALSYNSLVWTKTGSYISFDDDHGFPGPGFRLGFPVIQPLYYNSEVGKNAFLLIGTDGGRTELRQVGTSALYESADSSHILLDTTTMILRTTDGTQLKYQWQGSEYDCIEIKDRNGNFITINYNGSGQIANIHDTLDRTITFVYTEGFLTSIEQSWKKPSNPSESITHTWASFAYTNVPIQTNFAVGLAVSGPANGSNPKMLSKVTIDDNSTTPSQNSHYDFEYTSWGQVWKISNVAADNHVLNYRSYNLPPDASNALSECPRFTERRDWAENWNRNVSGVEQEAITSFSNIQAGNANVPGKNPQPATFVQVTNPNGTSSKIYFLGTPGTDTGWQVGLEYLVDSYDCLDTNPINPCTNSSLVRQIETLWTQDDETSSFVLNPRIAETNAYDPSGNRRRTRMVYESFSFADNTNCQLPKFVYEYKSDASTYLRTTQYSYVDHTNYAPRRILGLVSDRRLRDGNENGTVVSWVSYGYDENGSIDAANTPIMHDDANYGPSSIAGRGNLTSVTKHNVSTVATSTSTRKYDRAGSVVSQKDPLTHEIKFGYGDNFSDGNNSRQTFAYPKTLTDPDNFITTTVYNFDFGGVVSSQVPKPNSVSYQAGPVRTTVYDDLGRIERITNSVNAAYSRYQYSSSGNRLDVFSTMKDGANQQAGTEGQTFVVFDGFQRVIGSATKRAAGGFNGQRFEYDVMGRKVMTSNPAETTAVGSPSTWAATGADQSTGWKFTEQTYDWKDRIIRTINQDGTIRSAAYTGCGCAGGEVVTLTDEGTLVSGVNKRRQQTLYHDVLGRLVKTEVWDFEGTAIDGVNRRLDSTTVTTYNVRDQVTLVTEYAGAEGSSTVQETSMTYDGFGRLETQRMPHQRATSNQSWTSDHTTFHYDAEDKPDYIIDARGVKKQFSYQNNNRHLVTGLSYDLSALPVGQTAVPAVSAATFEYNAAGLRKKMTDGTGSITYTYNDLAQLTSEAREFNELPAQPYTLNYEYELGGQLKRITDHNNSTIKYNYDTAGQLSEVVGEGNLTANVSNYASGFEYRAWGAMRSVNFGNGTNQQTDFNSRLKPTNSSLNGLVPGLDSISWSYDYYEDGRQRHAYNPYDNRFDRLLEYDHVGRLKNAYSGREARGLAALTPNPDSPYQETFTYDAFDNRTQKSGRFWRTTQSGSTPCLPRHDFDGCDSEGGVVNSGNVKHTYDAASRQVNFEDWQFTVGGSPNHPDVEPGVEINQTYDADGRPTKRIETRRSEELIGSGPETNVLITETNTYFVYSTVLGGAKVIELGGGEGHVSTTYVYANGFRIAKQLIMSNINNLVVWNHVNPGSNSFVETLADKSMLREERDPDGAEMGLDDPWANVLEEPTYKHLKDDEPLYLEGGNPFDFSEGLTIDGLPVTRSEFDRRMRNGSAGAEVSVGGRPVAFVTNQSQQQSHITIDVFRVDKELAGLPQSQRWGGTYYIESFDIDLGVTRPASFAAANLPQKPQNPKKEPCAPTREQLWNNRTVQRGFASAWKDSKPGTDARHEEGGWIFWNSNTGRIAVRRAPSGTLNSLILTTPPSLPGFVIVGSFHTHPTLMSQGGQAAPDTREENIQYWFGVPGFVITESTNPDLPYSGIEYGPERRGSDPDRALSAKSLFGFPGNSVDSRGCP